MGGRVIKDKAGKMGCGILEAEGLKVEALEETGPIWPLKSHTSSTTSRFTNSGYLDTSPAARGMRVWVRCTSSQSKRLLTRVLITKWAGALRAGMKESNWSKTPEDLPDSWDLLSTSHPAQNRSAQEEILRLQAQLTENELKCSDLLRQLHHRKGQL